GNADHDPRMHQHLTAMRLVNEVVQHALGDLEVGDHAVLHGPDGDDVARCTTQHILRFLTNRFDFAVCFVNGDDGWLVHYDAFAFGKDQSICGAEVDGEIGRKQAKE